MGQAITVDVKQADGSAQLPRDRRAARGGEHDESEAVAGGLVPSGAGARNARRIFQQQTVPEILQLVLAGLAVQSPTATICLQLLRAPASRTPFASRLMEEEGIFYFFDIVQGMS